MGRKHLECSFSPATIIYHAILILLILFSYFAVLLIVSRLVGRGGNDAFFRGNRQSPWPLVAFGMVGASLSGVTFISVPGMVMSLDMTYLQMCMGFILGYMVVAFVLLPVYYRQGLTSIYGYLGRRFGSVSHKTGAWFFLISKMTGAAARLYIVCLILQQYALAPFVRHAGTVDNDALSTLCFVATVLVVLSLIWLYTRRGGIRTLVFTDTLQTFCLLAALILIFVQAARQLDMGCLQALKSVWSDSHSRVFEFTDWHSRQHFVKQFLSGVFIVVVMTGLDQDMMQKNLTCKSLRDGQKDLCTYGLIFLPVNFLFLALGVLLLLLYAKTGTPLPAAPDQLLPNFVATGGMGQWTLSFFSIGIVASAFSSADSALTALTTSFCVDICDVERRTPQQAERMRKKVHVFVTLAFVLTILAFRAVNSMSLIDAIYTLASYTYGPLLGLFAFGLFTRLSVRERLVPLVAVAAPIVSYLASYMADSLWDYQFGYELLLFNGALTFLGLLLSSRKQAIIVRD